MGTLLDLAKKLYWVDKNKDGKNDVYEYGNGDGTRDADGNGKNEIDCSRLVNNVLREAGYDLPKSNISTRNMEKSRYYDIATDGIKAGDLILFQGYDKYGKWVSHVGLVESYDPKTKTGKFFGSQSTTGPDTADFGPGTYWNMASKFLRPNPSPNPTLPIKSKVSDTTTRRDPLMMDLNGDGVINTLGLDAGIHFDHDGNGFAALTPFDTNGDGRIDASDPIWSQLKVWQHDPEATDIGDPDTSGILRMEVVQR